MKGLFFQSQDPPGGDTPPPADPPAQPSADTVPSSWEDVFKHPRFQELNKRAKEATSELERIRAAEKEANEKALAEQNKWKELYEGIQNDLKKERMTNLRFKVASSKGLPADLVDRLHGETEEELNADADKLLTLMKPGDPQKGVPPIGRDGKTPLIDLATETDPAKVRAAIRSGAIKQ